MAKRDKQDIRIEESHPLKWPEGWERTRIQDRKPHGGWPRKFTEYRAGVAKELGLMGATEILITYNPSPSDRMDPGVAVYFSMTKHEDYSWQEALGLNTPAPTLQQIDDAYRAKAMIYHPDRGGDVEIFKVLTKHRDNAKAWVQGTHKAEHEFCMACDRFTEPKLNLASIKMVAAAMRTMERCGVSGMLERAFRGFKTALPAHASQGVTVGS